MTDRKDQITALTEQQEAIAEMAAGVLVEHTPEALTEAVELTKGIKQYLKSVHDYWDELCDMNYKSWKATTARRKEFLDPGEAAEKAIKRKIALYYEKERKIEAAEHAKRVKEAAEAAALERMAEIEELQESGHLDEADYIAQQPLDLEPVAKPKETKAEGLSTSYRYHAEIVDLGEFLSFLAGEPRWQYLVKDFPMKELNKLATAQKDMFNFPGVKCVKEIIPSIKA